MRYPYNPENFTSFQSSEKVYDKAFLTRLYREMLRIRRIEEEIASRYHEDEMKSPIHLVIGQESTAVGVCAALEKTDLAFCGHRTHGVYLAKGGDLKAMMSELYCRANGCAGSRGGSMHLFDKSVGMESSSAIVAGSIPTSVGAAFASQRRKDKYICVSFLGDAATEEGAFWESLNFAALHKLPIVFICENNFFSVCSPLEVRQPKVAIYKKAESFGVPSVQIDGTKVLEVYAATRQAVERARSGAGPSFIESVAYRYLGHGGATDDSKSGYRDPAEVEHWREHDPISTFYDSLVNKGQLTATEIEKMEKEIRSEVLSAFEHAISSPEPGEEELMTYVYSD
jgi:acetoin:2,6-dichlorophenolindophenol oxidoreductase subunit alpha